MSSIWEVLCQTLTLSGVGLFILVMKCIFKDKLQPGWHLGVWIIFGLTALIPAGIIGRYALFNWQIIVSGIKAAAGDYSSLSVLAPVPLFEKGCFSGIAGIAFLIYCIGVIVMIMRYLVQYIRLKKILNQGTAADESLISVIGEIAEKHGLKECKALVAEGISSAFMCGIFKPVLVIPAEEETDEKVILHELIHYDRHDTLKGILIAAVRCIHWFNPFIWYCLNIVGNDVESYCDHKVLSLLEGEERRDYGRILLSMANDRYARMPGTSSMANGGKNISRRIETIVRFKKFPDGMTLAAVCITILMAVTCIGGFHAEASDGGLFFDESSYAKGISVNCTTMPGALDTYGKSLLTGYTSYRMMCATDEKRAEIAKEGFHTIRDKFDNIDMSRPFGIYNIVENDEGGYDAVMGFIQKPSDEDDYYEDYGDEYYEEEYYDDEEYYEDDGIGNCISQEVTVFKDNGRWVVEEKGDFKVSEGYIGDFEFRCEAMPYLIYSAKHEDYTVLVKQQFAYVTSKVETSDEDDTDEYMFDDEFYGYSSESRVLDLTPYVNGKFLSDGDSICYTIRYDGKDKEKITLVGISTKPMDSLEKRPSPEKIENPDESASSNDGICHESRDIESIKDWNGNELSIGGGGGGTSDSGHLNIAKPVPAYAADLYINGEKIAELVAKPEWEVSDDDD